MDMALNMGAFEALDQQEMMEVDGGSIFACLFVAVAIWAIGGVLHLMTR